MRSAAAPLAPDDAFAERVDDVVDEHPSLEVATKVGWLAKGFVYLAMGIVAVSIARRSDTDEEASPQGALRWVVRQPAGRILLILLAVGLVLYCSWRVLSVLLIRGNDIKQWLDRIGYSVSAAFYALLAWTAVDAALHDREVGESNSLERYSRQLLAESWGRWVVGLGGVVTMAVGLYFLVKKGLMRSFVDDLRGVNQSAQGNREWLARSVFVTGIAGWIGRGIVTLLVGFFITRAAWQVDATDVRGFDQSLRHISNTDTGTFLVWIAAVGLVLYGIFCLTSLRYRHLEVDR